MRLIAAILITGCAAAPPPAAPVPPPPSPAPDTSAPVFFSPDGEVVVREMKKGRIAIDHPSAARIEIDGRHVATGPYAGELELANGTHQLTILEPGCAPREVMFEVTGGVPVQRVETAGACLPAAAAAAPPPAMTAAFEPPSNAPAWALTGVGVAFTIAGAGLIGGYVAATARRGDLIAEDPERFDARPVRRADDQAFAFSIAAPVSFAVAAAAFGVAIWLFTTNTGEAPPDYNFDF